MSGPPQMQWSEFLPPDSTVVDEIEPGRFERQMLRMFEDPNTPAQAFKDYELRNGLFSLVPREHQQRELREGFSVVTLYKREIVGVLTGRTLWIEPVHREQGLAAEMQIYKFCKLGRDGWLAQNKQVRKGRPQLLTSGGLAVRKRVFRELVARGFIDPGPEGLPPL